MDDGGGTGSARPGDGRHEEPRLLRPEYVVPGEESLVPATDLVRPAPHRPTHELVADGPYRLDRPGQDRGPDGVLPAGTPVAVLRDEDDRCRVVTASGPAVDVPRASLRELPADTSGPVRAAPAPVRRQLPATAATRGRAP